MCHNLCVSAVCNKVTLCVKATLGRKCEVVFINRFKKVENILLWICRIRTLYNYIREASYKWYTLRISATLCMCDTLCM